MACCTTNVVTLILTSSRCFSMNQGISQRCPSTAYTHSVESLDSQLNRLNWTILTYSG